MGAYVVLLHHNLLEYIYKTATVPEIEAKRFLCTNPLWVVVHRFIHSEDNEAQK